jgi:hypothetical protein
MNRLDEVPVDVDFSLIELVASVQVLPQAKGQFKVLGGAWMKSVA